MSLSKTSLKKNLALFAVIILEGYVVLSTELLAIRQTIPFVGSGTDTVSIIIAAVLMPLALGYYAGGHFKPDQGSYKKAQRSIRNKLLFNLLISALILLPGLSHIGMQIFFTTLMSDGGLTNTLALTALYALIFLVTPIYLLGQTIPLISSYFGAEKLPRITGRIFFFSTLGSFAGAVISTLIFMPLIGVHNTATINILILTILILIISKNRKSEPVYLAIGASALALVLNSGTTLRTGNIIANNQYNLVSIHEDEEGFRHLSLNFGQSSKYRDDGRKHEYIEFMEDKILATLPKDASPKSILVIGSGAFTFGSGDKKNIYDYVDIDASLKETAETHILKKPLSPNKTFRPAPARGFLTQITEPAYDIIIIDVYLGSQTIPEHLVTKEFFEQVRSALKPSGTMAANIIASPTFANAYSRGIDNTIRSVFPYITRTVIQDDYDPWTASPTDLSNIIYLARKTDTDDDKKSVYTDNINRLFLDKPRTR